MTRHIRPFLLCSLLVLLASSTLAGATHIVIPGVANLEGANGTRFVSDLALTNGSDAAAEVRVSLIPTGGAAPAPYTLSLAPRSSATFRNVLEALWKLDRTGGALRVESEAHVVVRAQTYNATVNGAYGLSLPSLRDEEMISAGELATVSWVSQSSDLTGGFRTNVAVLFPDPSGGEATAVVLGANGEELGRRTFSAAAPSFQQDSVASFATARPVARLTLIVGRGRAQAYTAVVDNLTGDSSVYVAERSSDAATDVVVSGVARLSGANGTYFRSDVRLVNVGGSNATVTVQFWCQGVENRDPLTTTITLLPTETREITDVLATLFSLPEGSAGAIRFISAQPVRVAARTSNIDRSGAAGTFGAQQSAQPLASFARFSTVINGIAHDASARSNIGFTTSDAPADLRLALRAPDGSTTATAALHLPAYSWTQTSAVEFFEIAGITPGSVVEITPLAGAYAAYVSVVDQRSGDASVVVPSAAGCQSEVVIAAPERACQSEIISFEVSSTVGATYQWTVAGGTIVSGAGSRVIGVLADGSGALTARVAVSTNGCVSYATRRVAVDAPLVVALAKPGTVVAGSALQMTWSIDGEVERLEISGTDFSAPVTMHPSSRSFEYVAASPGTKSFTVTAKNGCGTFSTTQTYVVSTNTISGGSGGSGGAYPGLQKFPGADGREYVVYVPRRYDPAVPIPLVFALGGQGQPASSTLSVGWQYLAERDNIIVMTMTAATVFNGYTGAYGVAEFETILLAEREIPQRYNISKNQIYYWGFSAGGHVTYMFALTAERSKRLAAFGVHAAAIESAATRVNPPSWPPQAGARRLPVFISCGQNDTSGSGGGLIGALRRNSEMLRAENYPVVTREVAGQGHTYTTTEVLEAWNFLKQQKLP